MMEVEDDLALRERWLLQLVEELRGAGPEAHAQLTTLVHAAVVWYMAKIKVLKRKDKRKKKKKRGKGRARAVLA